MAEVILVSHFSDGSKSTNRMRNTDFIKEFSACQERLNNNWHRPSTIQDWIRMSKVLDRELFDIEVDVVSSNLSLIREYEKEK